MNNLVQDIRNDIYIIQEFLKENSACLTCDDPMGSIFSHTYYDHKTTEILKKLLTNMKKYIETNHS